MPHPSCSYCNWRPHKELILKSYIATVSDEGAENEPSEATSEVGSEISGRTEKPGLGKSSKKVKPVMTQVEKQAEEKPIVKKDDFGDIQKEPLEKGPRHWERGPLAT